MPHQTTMAFANQTAPNHLSWPMQNQTAPNHYGLCKSDRTKPVWPLQIRPHQATMAFANQTAPSHYGLCKSDRTKPLAKASANQITPKYLLWIVKSDRIKLLTIVSAILIRWHPTTMANANQIIPNHYGQCKSYHAQPSWPVQIIPRSTIMASANHTTLNHHGQCKSYHAQLSWPVQIWLHQTT